MSESYPKTGVAVIALETIRENPVALRQVNRQADSFNQIVDSVRAQGILNPINVRYKEAGRGGEPDGKFYEIIDGLHRYSAALEAGLDEIPVLILEKTDEEAMVAQIIGNVHRVDTAPGEYTRGLLRILSQNPHMTQTELAGMLAVSPAFIEARLSLNKLDPEILKLVDNDQIKLSNAFPLAKLPLELQKDWVERAITMGVAEFGPLANAEVKRLNEEKRKGNAAAGPQVFEPVPIARKLGEIKAEHNNSTIGPAIIRANGVVDPAEAFALGIAWTLQMDPQSKEAQVNRHKEREKKAAEDKVRRDAERAALREQEALKKQDELKKAAAEKRAQAEAMGLVQPGEDLTVKAAKTNSSLEAAEIGAGLTETVNA